MIFLCRNIADRIRYRLGLLGPLVFVVACTESNIPVLSADGSELDPELVTLVNKVVNELASVDPNFTRGVPSITFASDQQITDEFCYSPGDPEIFGHKGACTHNFDRSIYMNTINASSSSQIQYLLVHELAHNHDFNTSLAAAYKDIAWTLFWEQKSDVWDCGFLSLYSAMSPLEDYAEGNASYFEDIDSFEQQAQSCQGIQDRYDYLYGNVYNGEDWLERGTKTLPLFTDAMAGLTDATEAQFFTPSSGGLGIWTKTEDYASGELEFKFWLSKNQNIDWQLADTLVVPNNQSCQWSNGQYMLCVDDRHYYRHDIVAKTALVLEREQSESFGSPPLWFVDSEKIWAFETDGYFHLSQANRLDFEGAQIDVRNATEVFGGFSEIDSKASIVSGSQQSVWLLDGSDIRLWNSDLEKFEIQTVTHRKLTQIQNLVSVSDAGMLGFWQTDPGASPWFVRRFDMDAEQMFEYELNLADASLNIKDVESFSNNAYLLWQDSISDQFTLAHIELEQL